MDAIDAAFQISVGVYSDLLTVEFLFCDIRQITHYCHRRKSLRPSMNKPTDLKIATVLLES